MGRRCSGGGSSGCSIRPLISVPAFCLCHCTKMWVSLVNTLEPRPREHILTSCCVGSGLRIDKVGMGEGAMGLYDGIDLDLKHSTDGDHNYEKSKKNTYKQRSKNQ